MTTMSHEAGIKAAYVAIMSKPSQQLFFKKEGRIYSYPHSGINIRVDDAFITAFINYTKHQGKHIILEDRYRATAVEFKGLTRTVTPSRHRLIGKMARITRRSMPSTVRATAARAPTHHDTVLRHPRGATILRQARHEGKRT